MYSGSLIERLYGNSADILSFTKFCRFRLEQSPTVPAFRRRNPTLSPTLGAIFNFPRLKDTAERFFELFSIIGKAEFLLSSYGLNLGRAGEAYATNTKSHH
jgi:hypothetical protein